MNRRNTIHRQMTDAALKAISKALKKENDMNQRELLDTLKKNDKGWMFLSPREQTFMRKANQQGKVRNLRFDGGWSGLGGWDCLGDGANEIWRVFKE